MIRNLILASVFVAAVTLLPSINRSDSFRAGTEAQAQIGFNLSFGTPGYGYSGYRAYPYYNTYPYYNSYNNYGYYNYGYRPYYRSPRAYRRHYSSRPYYGYSYGRRYVW